MDRIKNIVNGLLFFSIVMACGKNPELEKDGPKDNSSTRITSMVATVNIRYENAEDDANGHSWVSRKPMISDMVKKYDYDIFGTQEGLGNQIADLQTELPDYSHFGISRDNDDEGEHATMFYKKNKYELLDKGDFWLSTTPDVPSKSWDAKFPMNTTWGKFKEKSSGYVFYVFNTHYDPVGTIARVESSKVMLDQAKKIAGSDPLIMTGDFNSTQTSEAYNILNNSDLVRDAHGIAQAKSTHSAGTTFNNWNINPTGSNRIDHIFVSPQWIVKTHSILRNTYGGKLPSDHYPVLVQLEGR